MTIRFVRTEPNRVGIIHDISASYVVSTSTGSLPNERVLTAGPNITINDYGSTIAVTGSAAGGSIFDTSNDSSGSTTNNTPTTLYTYATLAADQIIDMRVRAIGRQTGGVSGSVGDTTKIILEAIFERTGSTVTSIDENVISFYPSSSFDVQFNITGSSIQVQVVGENGRNMNWRLITEINEHG